MQTELIAEGKFCRSQERRRYLRFSYVWPIRFLEADGKLPSLTHIGKCKNLSQGGMKITALSPLERGMLALLEVNLNALSIVISTSKLIVTPQNQILSQVAWRSLNLDTGLFDAGLEFLPLARKHEFESLLV